jgi:thioredoxin-like negative regulator of GroEL
MKNWVLFYLLLMSISFVKYTNAQEIEIPKLITITSSEQMKKQTESGITLVFFHASHCNACEMQLPTIEQLPYNGYIQEHHIACAEVDFDIHKDIFDAFHIASFPYIAIYKNGVEVSNLSGMGHNQQAIVDMLKGVE